MLTEDYLRELAERLLRIPPVYDVGQQDAARLRSIASRYETMRRTIEDNLAHANARLNYNLGDER